MKKPLTIRVPEEQYKKVTKLKKLKNQFISTSISNIYIIAMEKYLESNAN